MIEGVVSDAPMQKPELSFIEGNFLQLRDRKEEPRGDTRLEDGGGGLQRGVVSKVRSGLSHEHAQKDSERLALAASLVIGLVPGSLVKETMPLRQRGQGIDPGGPLATPEE